MTRSPALFGVGVVVLFVSLLPPVDAEAARFFWVHMSQHMVIVLVAAPLIALSRLFNVRLSGLRSVVFVGAINAVALWAWHMPVLYDAAMRNVGLHILEHFTFLATALLFWNLVFDVEVDRFKRVGLVLATMLQSGALGALIAFASQPLYQWHIENTPTGYDVLAQQQVAGAIMWVPPGVVYLGVMVGLIWRALSAFDAAEQP